MANYTQYESQIAKFAKKNYNLTIDFKDENIKGICEQGFRLGSFPYYCASQISIYLGGIDKGDKKPTVKFKLFYDEDWEEWQVRVLINGKLNKAKSAHCSDRDDAIGTRHAIITEFNEHPERYGI